VESFSNDRQWKAVLFIRHCGIGASEFHVSVLPAAASLSNEAGNAFRQDATHEGGGRHSYHMQQVWKGPHELWISHDRGMTVAFAASAVGPVAVVHTDEEILEH
jgi:hypothetical protein